MALEPSIIIHSFIHSFTNTKLHTLGGVHDLADLVHKQAPEIGFL
jgi:hypothetical protein